MKLTRLQRRCVEISYKQKLSHVSSVLNSVDLIAEIYSRMYPQDPFVLGNAHAALALFVVLESLGKCDAEQMSVDHGTHCFRDMQHGVWVSGGSLGQSETVAVGMAIADPSRTVRLMTSDGACAEGSVWEALRLINDFSLHNITVDVIANGYGAYGPIDLDNLQNRLDRYPFVTMHRVRPFEFDWLNGLAGHYLILDEVQYKELMEI